MSELLDGLQRDDRITPVDSALARSLMRLGDEVRDEVGLAVALASRAVGDGHVCLDLERAVAGGLPGAPPLDAWLAALRHSPLIDPGGDADAPLVLDAEGRLYLRRYWAAERELARALLARAAAPDLPCDAAHLDAALDRRLGDAPPRQRAAAHVAMRRPLCVISGGPGTGKTTLVKQLLALLAGQPPPGGASAWRVRMLAPTGKAARRLEEACGEVPAGVESDAAATLHRALGARPGGGFRHGPDDPLRADVVIVDEASMVDLPLMARLVGAVRDDARLILLGDRHQLASVEAGAVLADICGGGEHDGRGEGLAGCIVELDHVFRYDPDAGLGRLAAAVRRGDSREALAILDDPAHPDVRRLAPPPRGGLGAELAAAVRRDYGAYLEAPDVASALAAFRATRVLCAHHRGGAGAVAVGAAIERELARAGQIDPASAVFYPGRPVVVTRNDHAQELYNGDVALIWPTGSDEPPRAAVDAGADRPPRLLATSRLPAHETVYAMTVHKSQGSQFERVSIVLPDVGSRLLGRELLYTALTRARHGAVLHASAEALRACVETPAIRDSGLRARLWDGGPEVPPSPSGNARRG